MPHHPSLHYCRQGVEKGFHTKLFFKGYAGRFEFINAHDHYAPRRSLEPLRRGAVPNVACSLLTPHQFPELREPQKPLDDKWRAGGAEKLDVKYFSKFAIGIAGMSGKSVLAETLVLIWTISGPFFGYSETWELVIIRAPRSSNS
jgi:hypothetical protein